MLQTPMPSPAADPGEALQELSDEFELLGDWEERYRHVIDLGRDLEPLEPEERTEANKVRGCASQVARHKADGRGRARLRGDSDAHIVRGLIAILLRFYSGRSPRQILEFDAKAALTQLGLASALSAQRSNGLTAMIARIRADADQAGSRLPPRRKGPLADAAAPGSAGLSSR
jgi:cysteine desulfuration protein SufE